VVHCAQSTSGDLLANDFDADGDPLWISAIEGVPLTGSTTLSVLVAARCRSIPRGRFRLLEQEEWEGLQCNTP
jgi:hypothetical protein